MSKERCMVLWSHCPMVLNGGNDFFDTRLPLVSLMTRTSEIARNRVLCLLGDLAQRRRDAEGEGKRD